jgi:hypothetical protein
MMQLRNSRAFSDGSLGADICREGLILLLTIALLGVETVPAFAQASQTPDPSWVESQVKKFGVGKSVKITLVGGEQIAGHIRAIGSDSFTVRISKKSAERTIPYAQVAEIKDPGPLMWILIGAAIVIIIIVAAHH